MDAASDPDFEFARRAADGDREAFAHLLEKHYDLMHRIAWRMTGSRTDAEDLAQDVCCRLVDTIGSFRGASRFTTWLTGVVMNAARDHLRRRSSWRRITDQAMELARIDEFDDASDPHTTQWVRSEIARLDPALRAAVVLVAGEGLTHAEAANALGVAEGTISWRLHEARKHLDARGVKEAING